MCIVVALVLNGDYFLGSVLATALTKLVLRYAELNEDFVKVNTVKSEVL